MNTDLTAIVIPSFDIHENYHNLLTLNSSKTAIRTLVLQKQLYKIQNSLLDTPPILIVPFDMPHLVSGINQWQPHSSLSVSDLPVLTSTSSSHTANSPLSPSVTPSFFHSRLKTYFFSFTNLSHQTLSSGLRTDSTDFMTGPFLLSISVSGF